MIPIFCDTETTYQVIKGKKNPSPFLPENKLVSVGIEVEGLEPAYVFFHHNQREPTKDGRAIVQEALWKGDIFIAHNAKFDLMWLLECGFEYDGPVWCTMNGAYVMLCGRKLPLDLDSCCERFGVEGQKDKVIDKYMDDNISFEDIPPEIVERYGMQDLNLLKQLYYKQLEVLSWRA